MIVRLYQKNEKKDWLIMNYKNVRMCVLWEKLRRNIYSPICRDRNGTRSGHKQQRLVCSRLINFARQWALPAGVLEDKWDHFKMIARQTDYQTYHCLTTIIVKFTWLQSIKQILGTTLLNLIMFYLVTYIHKYTLKIWCINLDRLKLLIQIYYMNLQDKFHIYNTYIYYELYVKYF